MLLELIGAGFCAYTAAYLVSMFFVDCDLELWFYSKFGHTPAKLKGQVVCITGASSGIGEHMAKALAKHGVRLVLTARRKTELERVKRECLEISKGQLCDEDVLVLPFDILDFSVHERVFEDILRHFKTLHVLVNNAGRTQRALFENIELNVDREIFEINVFSVVNLSRIAVRYFNEKGCGGHVAVVSSVGGAFAAPYSASYTATKHAIHGYFGALRAEKVGQKISVTLLCPGPTRTNFLQESFTEKEGEKLGIPMSKTDKRMSAERCGELFAIALANKTRESWVGLFPMIPVTYAAVYLPIISNIALNTLGPKRIFKFRDSKPITLDNTKHKR